VPFASKQLMNRGSGVLPFQVPEGQVNTGHGRDRNAPPSEVNAPFIHLVPQTFCVQRVLTNQQFPQAAREAVAERSINDSLSHFRTGVNFTDTLKPGVRLNADEQSVLGTCRFVSHLRQSQYLSDYALNFHFAG
jgi:hypothetical protein